MWHTLFGCFTLPPFLLYSGRYDFMYSLPYCFGIFFILLKMMFKFIYFAFLVQFFYSRILIESFLINSCCLFLLLPFFIKFILFLHWIFNVFSYSWLRYYFVFSFFMVLIGACLSKILLMKHKKVSKPKFISLFSVTNDQ